jgi:DNA-binding NtrC family response regulator
MKKENVANVPRVLIVDDEVEIGLLLKRVLRKKFSVIEHALTIEEGLSFANTLKPNVILLDNNLPDGSGIERLGDFRSVYPDTCIIVVSAMTHLGKLALEKGAFAFIEKPLSFTVIMQTIDDACNNCSLSGQ